MPFEDKKINFKKGAKLNNSTSSAPAPPKTTQQEELDKAAKVVFDRKQDYKNRIAEISTQFKATLEDQTLPINRTSISKNLEQELKNKLILLSHEMNNDASEPESQGSMFIAILALSCLWIQRDIINDISYRLEQLERQTTKSV
jgi:hypothetical protein